MSDAMFAFAGPPAIADAAMSASPAALVAELCDQAIIHLQTAHQALTGGRAEDAGRAGGRACECIGYLWLVLDQERGGSRAVELGRLYRFMLDRIVVALKQSDAAAIHGVIELLAPLKAAWQTAAERKPTPAKKPAPHLHRRAVA